ncbi:MAG: hypothetical protein UT43_C0046G0008 [Parcubacteria group bacterium GW2011_GWC1_39_29]|nr:MAG: hypothetical protein UT43_C0046G0008 [Parcubacteria group bacterium GW2011_GWC1_39_29]
MLHSWLSITVFVVVSVRSILKVYIDFAERFSSEERFVLASGLHCQLTVPMPSVIG